MTRQDRHEPSAVLSFTFLVVLAMLGVGCPAECPAGTEGCPCAEEGACDGELTCARQVCTAFGSTDDEDGGSIVDVGDGDGDGDNVVGDVIPPVCNQSDSEPNDDVSQAVNLGNIGDDDSEGGQVAGTLQGLVDTDWFKYRGSDDWFYTVDPSVALESGYTARVCMWLTCVQGATLLNCPMGSSALIGDEGVEGCCFEPEDNNWRTLDDVDCEGTDDDLLVEIRVDSSPDNVCANYTLKYHF